MIQSDFNKGIEGWWAWTVTGADTGIGEVPGYDHKYDYISIGPSSGDEYFRAGPEWTGDLSEYFGADFSFRLRQDGSNWYSYVTVQIVGTGGTTLYASFDQRDDRDWHSYSVTFDQFSDWRTSTFPSVLANESDIREVLGSVDRILIQGGRSGTQRTDLDDVWLRENAPNRIALVTSDTVLSNFNNSGENWSFLHDVKNFKQVESGGVTGGFLQAVDNVSGSTMYYAAPDEFEGQKAGFFGGTLSFSMKVNGTGFSSTSWQDVIIRGANGHYITWAMEENPGTDWTPYWIQLDETGRWSYENTSNATDAQIQAILADVLSIEIRGEYIFGPETVGLDNVKLSAPDGRFDILAEERSALLLATTDRFDKAIELLNDGNVLDTGPGEALDKTFTINVDEVKILAGDALSGKITLGDDIRALQVSAAGKTLEVEGNGLDNSLRVTGPDSRFIEVSGGAGDDFLFAAADYKKGTARLLGEADNDTLLGGTSSDKLIGGTGADTLDGQKGNDRLLGGKGADTFVFGDSDRRDTILDFGKGADVIKLERTGFDSFDDLVFKTWNGNLAIAFDDEDKNMIVLDGYTDSSELSASDFVFA